MSTSLSRLTITGNDLLGGYLSRRVMEMFTRYILCIEQPITYCINKLFIYMESRISMMFCIILAFVCFFNTSAFAQLNGDTYASAKKSKRATWILTHSDSPGLA